MAGVYDAIRIFALHRAAAASFAAIPEPLTPEGYVVTFKG